MRMYKQSATDLTTLPAEEVKNWMKSFDAVLTDCDGVLWLFNEIIQGSVEVINKFKEYGKKVYFVTNNSTKTRSEFLEKALRLGYNMKEDEIISTAYATAAYLKKLNFNKKVYIVGSSGIGKELEAVSIAHDGIGPEVLRTNLNQYIHTEFKLDPDIGAVIVGFDEHFSFPKLTKAVSYLNDPECLFLATNTDERFPMPKWIIPGTGSMVRAIEACAERQAIVMGKPNPSICEELLCKGIIVPERTLMIGDRCNTDILLGKNCGFQTLLVGSGIHKLSDCRRWMEKGTSEQKDLIPDVYLPTLGHLLNYM